jgi:hypothetical protein
MATVLEELVSILGFEVEGKENLNAFKRGLDDASKKSDSFAQSVTNMARGVTSGLIAAGAAIKGATAGMFAMANAAAGPLDELVKSADRASVSVEVMQELGFAAEQSGSSVSEMSNAVEMMSTRLAEAARGQGRAKTALEAYGLSATDASGKIKNAADFMGELADVFQDISEAERLDLGRQLGLSRGLITMLAQGNDEIERLRQVARDAGLIFTEEDARNAEAYNDAMNLLMRTVRSMRDRIAIDLLPTLMKMIGGMQDWFNANREVIQQNVGAFMERIARHSQTLSNNLPRLAEAVKGFELALIPLLRILFPKLFILAAVAVAVDDFLTYLEGGESIIGTFVQGLQDMLGVSEGLAETLTAIAGALALFAVIKPGAFLRMVGGLGRLFLAALGLKTIGGAAVLTGVGTGIAGIAAVSATKLFLIAGALWAIYNAANALSTVSLGENIREFMKDVAPPQTKAEQDKAVKDGPVGFLGGAVGNFLMRSQTGLMQTLGIMPSPSDGASVQPQSLGTMSGEEFSDRFGQYLDQSDKSTNIDVGGITVNPSPGMNEEGLARAMRDRLLSIHGQTPVTP